MTQALRIATTSTDRVRMTPVAVRAFKPGQLDSLFRAGRALAERAIVARDMPRTVPDLVDVVAGCDRDVEQAIADLMEAING